MRDSSILDIAREFKKSYVISILLVLFFGPFGLFYSTVTFGVVLSVIFVVGIVILVPSSVHELLTYFKDPISNADFFKFFDMLRTYDYFQGPVFYLLLFYTIISVLSLGLCIYYIYVHNKNTYGLALSLHEYSSIVRGINKNNDSAETGN